MAVRGGARTAPPVAPGPLAPAGPEQARGEGGRPAVTARVCGRPCRSVGRVPPAAAWRCQPCSAASRVPPLVVRRVGCVPGNGIRSARRVPVSHVPPSAVSPCQPHRPVGYVAKSAVSPPLIDHLLCQPCSPVSHVHLLAISPISHLPHQPVPSVSYLPHQPYSASARPPCQPHHQLPARSVSAISCAPLSVMSPHQCCPPLPAVYPNSCPVSNIMSPSASSP